MGRQISSGDQVLEERRQLDYLFSVTYEELRRLAASVKRNNANATLNPTALVNEAWLKLAGSPHVAATSRLHFKRIAARAMRQVLVEAARRNSAGKRGGAMGTVYVTFDDSLVPAPSSEAQILRPRRRAQRAGTDEPPAGGNGRDPLLRRAECRRDGVRARGLGSDDRARLAGGQAWLALELRRAC